MPSEVSTPISYKTNLKRAFVNALKLVFNENYPDHWNVLQNIFVTTNWPDKPEQFPLIMVNYQETDKPKNAGIGHFEHIPYTSTVYKR